MKKEEFIPKRLSIENIDAMAKLLSGFVVGKKLSIVMAKGGCHQPPSLVTSTQVRNIKSFCDYERIAARIIVQYGNESIAIEANLHNHVDFDFGPSSVTVTLWSREFKKFIIFSEEK